MQKIIFLLGLFVFSQCAKPPVLEAEVKLIKENQSDLSKIFTEYTPERGD